MSKNSAGKYFLLHHIFVLNRVWKERGMLQVTESRVCLEHSSPC